MKVLDLFCGAGGASMGYYQAGFTEVVGVDINPQPHYPFKFYQADALDYLYWVDIEEFDLIHASPPCQRFSVMRRGRWQEREHADLLEPIREQLKKTGIPYVIENVVGAPLIDPVMLCGSMFGLQTKQGNQLRRHRLFESPWLTSGRYRCKHNTVNPNGVYGGGQHPERQKIPTIGVYGSTGGSSIRDQAKFFGVEARREAMGIDWMINKELTQAIPPAYTKWIGEQILGRL